MDYTIGKHTFTWNEQVRVGPRCSQEYLRGKEGHVTNMGLLNGKRRYFVVLIDHKEYCVLGRDLTSIEPERPARHVPARTHMERRDPAQRAAPARLPRGSRVRAAR